MGGGLCCFSSPLVLIFRFHILNLACAHVIWLICPNHRLRTPLPSFLSSHSTLPVYSNIYSRLRGAEKAGGRCSSCRGPCTWHTVPLSGEAAVVPATGHCCRDSIPLGFSPPPCTLTPSPSCLFLCPPSPHFHPSHTHTHASPHKLCRKSNSTDSIL